MSQVKRDFAKRDAEALGREAERIAELCREFLKTSSVPPKP